MFRSDWTNAGNAQQDFFLLTPDGGVLDGRIEILINRPNFLIQCHDDALNALEDELGASMMEWVFFRGTLQHELAVPGDQFLDGLFLLIENRPHRRPHVLCKPSQHIGIDGIRFSLFSECSGKVSGLLGVNHGNGKSG